MENIRQGDIASIARAVSLVDSNDESKYDLLKQLQPNPKTLTIGVTGPPGAGKSTLTSALVEEVLSQNPGVKVAIMAIDPSSPFHLGALLGDRIRMSEHFLDDRVFIRSLASKGSLGGLNPNALEVLYLLRSADFDYVIIETVGVGQSEVEIAGLADVTVLVLVPEAGDEVQIMKSGVLEVADLIVLNKADRPDADGMYHKLRAFSKETKYQEEIPVVKVIANQKQGLDKLYGMLQNVRVQNIERKAKLQTRHVLAQIQRSRMKSVSEQEIYHEILEGLRNNASLNIFQLSEKYQ